MCAMNTKSLGRGLDALFQNEHTVTGLKNDMRRVPIAALIPNPEQPRQNFDLTAHKELAESIKNQGIIQPLLVRPISDSSWEIVAGERRWRAAKEAGLTEVPVYIRNLTDQEIMVAALTENLQRENLNPVEEAHALEKLLEMLQLTQEELAERLGRSRPSIANALRLLKLSSEAKEDLRNGLISAGHARCLLGIGEEAAATTLLQEVRARGMSVRETEEAAATWRNSGKFPWNEADLQREGEKRQRQRKKSTELRNLQNSLQTCLSCKASINGDENSGRITLNYESREKLYALLELLGVKD